jgi:hypothetical protein
MDLIFNRAICSVLPLIAGAVVIATGATLLVLVLMHLFPNNKSPASGYPGEYEEITLVILVRYHCGGWPEEVNTCFLNSCMVYL